MEKSEQFKKNFIWNILGTGFNAFNSLFFLVIVTRINGVNDAGIFTIAYSTACILYMLGVYVGRIYQVTETDKTINDKDYIVNRIITTITMLVLVGLFALIRGYNLFKTIVFILLTLFKGLEAFSDVIYGILQKNEKLEIVGKSYFIKSLLSVVSFIVIDYFTKNMIITIVSINIINILIMILYDFNYAKHYINFNEIIHKTSVMKIFKAGFYTFAIAFLGIYLINAPKYAIDTYLPNDIQTIFGIIVMPATVVGLVAQFLIHPYLNQILDIYEKRDIRRLNVIKRKLIFSILGFGLISSILAYFLGPEVLGLIYGIDLSLYRVSLLIIIISATIYTIGVIYSSILTTMRDTFSQFIIYLILSVFAYITSNVMTKIGALNGAVWAYLSIMLLQFMTYTIYSNIKFKLVFNNRKE